MHTQDDHLEIGLSIKHIMTKFVLLNVGYTDHAIGLFGYIKSTIRQLI